MVLTLVCSDTKEIPDIIWRWINQTGIQAIIHKLVRAQAFHKHNILIINPGPFEPGYALPLQAV